MTVLRTYNAEGQFKRRTDGKEVNLRALGRTITTMCGQLVWRCVLFRDGVRVATCRRSVWMEVKTCE